MENFLHFYCVCVCVCVCACTTTHLWRSDYSTLELILLPCGPGEGHWAQIIKCLYSPSLLKQESFVSCQQLSPWWLADGHIHSINGIWAQINSGLDQVLYHRTQESLLLWLDAVTDRQTCWQNMSSVSHIGIACHAFLRTLLSWPIYLSCALLLT